MHSTLNFEYRTTSHSIETHPNTQFCICVFYALFSYTEQTIALIVESLDSATVRIGLSVAVWRPKASHDWSDRSGANATNDKVIGEMIKLCFQSLSSSKWKRSTLENSI